MRVLNVVSVLSAVEGGGNADRTVYLSRFLMSRGIDCTVLTLDIGNPCERIRDLSGARLVVLRTFFSRYQVPVPHLIQIARTVASSDVIHLMGHWSPLSALVALFARRMGVPYVICPGGALRPFGRSRLAKQLFNWVCGKDIVRDANGWIAVTKREVGDFSSYGVDPSLVSIIPNGVEKTTLCDAEASGAHVTNRKNQRFVLFVGRLNYIKGPDILLESFGEISKCFLDCQLIFAGPDEGMMSFLRDRTNELGLGNRVQFKGYVTGLEKMQLYRDASILVVPSRSEAMSIVAIEAGLVGTPTLVTDQCGLETILEVSPYLVADSTPGSVSEALMIALSSDERLTEWGRKWQSIVLERYMWDQVGLRYVSYFNDVCGTNKP